MTILLDYRPALRRRTGVGEYAHELAAALARGHRPGDRLLLFTSSLRDRPDPALAAGWPGTVVIDRRVPVRVLHRAWHRFGWPPVEWLAGRQVDVAHSMHPLLIPSRHARPVVTIHDLDFLRHPERTRAEVRRDYPALVRQHAARAALVVVNSHHTAGAVEAELGIPAGRIVICRPGLPAWIRAAPPPPPARDGYALFMGTLEPRKNIARLLEAWEHVASRPDVHATLRLAGTATPDAAPWLARLKAPPLAGRAEHVGYVPDAERRALYGGAGVLVLPSLHEGFGLPALEAMALGVPVVVANRGALPEVVGDAGLLVDPEDPGAMATALHRVLTDAPLAADLRARGLARAAEFTWDTAASTLRDAFDDLLSRPADDAHRD